MPMVPVDEAAGFLGATRRQVRRMARAGLISGRQSPAGWLLDKDSVLRRGASQPPSKRPWPIRAARAVLDALRSVGPPGNSQSGENQRSSGYSDFSG
ncbi:MAG: helix-turn-helix domain-containing protein [Acidimicrobiales bacterium]